MAKFTNDWFNIHIPVWERLLAELKGKPITAVELGSYEGRSTCWLLENILTHPKARIFCVDTWEGGEEHDHEEMPKVRERFVQNVEDIDNTGKVTMCTMTTTKFFYQEHDQVEADLIYVDASHQSKDVLSDAIMAHHMLKPGGILVFDDYLWAKMAKGFNVPKGAVDAFMDCYADEYELLGIGYQVILKRNGKENTETDS